PHGAQKLLGWFGGPGVAGTIGMFQQMHIPAPVAFLVMCAEFFGSLLLLLGLFTRVAAAGIFLVMLGAVLTVDISNGFFMNWTGTQAGEGFEYHLLAMGLALALIMAGGGHRSVDLAATQRLDVFNRGGQR